MSKYICNKCGRHLDGIRYDIDGRGYCHDCYQSILLDKQEVELQKSELYAYICRLFQVNDLPSETVASLDRIIKNGKKIKAIQLTLHYYYEIENHNIDRVQLCNIGYIIDNNYERTRQYLTSVKEIQAKNKEVNLDVPPVTIKINPKKIQKTSHTLQRTSKIEKL